MKNRDMISEQDYTIEMAAGRASPEDDSPGDSDSDMGMEFLMGVAFEPEKSHGIAEDTGTIDRHHSGKKRDRVISELPESAVAVFSDQH